MFETEGMDVYMDNKKNQDSSNRSGWLRSSEGQETENAEH